MIPDIRNNEEKRLIGKKMTMNYADNKTEMLWKSFMQEREKLQNLPRFPLYSVQVYPGNFFVNFNPYVEFEKWAAVEHKVPDVIPGELLPLIIPAGLYAVFVYHGSSANAGPFFQNIFTNWLPAAGYRPADRPHFEVLGEEYKHGHEQSEEEIWIPVTKTDH